MGVDAGIPRPGHAPVGQEPLVPCRGENRLAELEAIVVLGGGSFRVGVSHVVGLYARVGIVKALQDYPGHVFGPEWIDKRSWSTRLRARDATLLRGLGTSTSEAISTALTIAMPHTAPGYNGALRAALDRVLAEEAEARAWMSRGVIRRWNPPPEVGVQTHFVQQDEDPGLLPPR